MNNFDVLAQAVLDSIRAKKTEISLQQELLDKEDAVTWGMLEAVYDTLDDLEDKFRAEIESISGFVHE